MILQGTAQNPQMILKKYSFEYVVTMGCGDECPFIPAVHRVDWDIPDPRNMDKDEFRKVRDLIEEKVKQLLKVVA
jgi:arsenate reductase